MKTLKELRKKQPESTDMSKKELEDEATQAAKAAAAARWKVELFEIYNKLILRDDVYYINDQAEYVFSNIVKGWIAVEQAAIRKKYQITNAMENQTFDECLHLMNRVRDSVVNTFNKTDNSVLNLLNRESWLKPVSGAIHPIFNIMLQSITSGQLDAQEHIEQCIVWKYLHPEDYKIPCITISGAGGICKNEFTEHVLGNVFGKNLVKACDADAAFGTYNGVMLGKAVLYIDEAIPTKVVAEKLKRKVGNPTIDINNKYGIQGNFDNTAWYWLGGNGSNGNAMLAGDITDRRYSVITVDRSIMHWVGKHLGLEVDGRTLSLGNDHPCIIWYADNEHIMQDPNEVAAWLYHILEKHKSMTRRPSAFHKADYLKLIETQSGEFEETMDWVFNDEQFEHIEKVTLYKVYELFAKQNNSLPRQAKNFHADCASWLVKNHKPYALSTNPVRISKELNKNTSSHVYSEYREYSSDGKNIDNRAVIVPVKSYWKRNDDYYIEYDEFHRYAALTERDVVADPKHAKLQMVY